MQPRGRICLVPFEGGMGKTENAHPVQKPNTPIRLTQRRKGVGGPPIFSRKTSTLEIFFPCLENFLSSVEKIFSSVGKKFSCLGIFSENSHGPTACLAEGLGRDGRTPPGEVGKRWEASWRAVPNPQKAAQGIASPRCAPCSARNRNFAPPVRQATTHQRQA